MLSNGNRYECDACGACCQTFPVRVSKDDGLREPRIASNAMVLPEWQQQGEHYFQLHPLPFCDGCMFLGEEKLCSIYPTRPNVCRDFAAGSEQCQEARERQGLPRLEPTS